MKSIVFFSMIVAAVSMWQTKSTCEPAAIPFVGNEWAFPSTAGEAVHKHQMDYKPPVGQTIQEHERPFEYN